MPGEPEEVPAGVQQRQQQQRQQQEEQEGAPPAAASASSALHDNIERKGKNAYYYAHAHKVNGPKWDGKAEPRLLSRSESIEGHPMMESMSLDDNKKKVAAFDYSKSNITKYAFLDEGGKKVKLYIDLDSVGEKCSSDDVNLDYAESSFELVVNNYYPGDGAGSGSAGAAPTEKEPPRLCFGKLAGKIVGATFRLKKDKIILTLTKSDANERWHTITELEDPKSDDGDREVV